MAVMMPRERWTDERLDKAFDRVDGDIRELRVEMRQGFERIDKRFDQIDKRFEKVDDKFDAMQSEMNAGFARIDEKFDRKFDSLQRTMIIGFVTLFAGIIASVLGAFFLA
jgi:hypothetical protein